MDAVRNYILTLTGFSFISSLVCSVIPDISAKKTVKFVCGIILCILMLAPIKNTEIDFSDIFDKTETYNLYSENYTSALDLRNEIITDRVAETISETFGKYGVWDIAVEVVFDSEGNISEISIDKYDSAAINEIAQVLGIPAEIIHITE